MTSSVEALPFFSTVCKHGALAIRADDALLNRVTIPNLRHIADIDRLPVDGLDRNIVQRLDRLRAAV